MPQPFHSRAAPDGAVSSFQDRFGAINISPLTGRWTGPLNHHQANKLS